MTRMTPLRVRAFAGLVAAAGAATLGVALVIARHLIVQDAGVLVAFTAALALTWAFPLLLFRNEETESLQLDEAFLVAMALLLPSFEIVIAFAIGVALGNLARRRALIRSIFNVGQSVTAVGLALVCMHALGALGGPMDAAGLAGVIAGAAVFFVVQTGTVSGVIALAERRSFASEFFDGIGIRSLIWVGNISAGLLAGLVGHAYPWALAFAALPIGLLQLAFAGHLRARRDRERMNGLFHAAQLAHASMGIGDVEESLAESAKSLLRCEHSRFDHSPPGSGELGAKLDVKGESERWFIASERRGVEPFNAADQKLLEALAAIGTGALENASLYHQAQDERKKLADVVGSSSDGIFSVDYEGRVSSWNPAMEAITGYSAEEMVGTRHLGALRPRDSRGADLMTEGWTKQEATPEPDIQILTRRGEIRWLSCAFSQLHEGGYVAVARDITAQKQIEELKTDFLATVSHELRTPLTPIQGFLLTLLRTDADFPQQERHKFYQIMLGQTERLGRLVEDLLEAVSLREGARRFQSARVHWAAAAAGVVDLARAQNPGRELVFDVRGEIPLVAADQQRAEQILSNLITNALKYSDPSEPVTVSISSDGQEVITTVSDRGPGIPEADSERIFERFTRLGDHMTRKVGGVGLGLYIARQLAEGMGGRIWVRSVAGQGAQFSFSLMAQNGVASVGLSRSDAAGEFGPTGHSHLLVAESPETQA